MPRYPSDWMWSEACEMLVRAERMHREFFRPAHPVSGGPAWQPPVDVLETDHQILILMALPGVDDEQVETLIEGDELVVRGSRILPPALRTALIHRLELPQGRFERRLVLPAGRYADVRRNTWNGCLVITLEKN